MECSVASRRHWSLQRRRVDRGIRAWYDGTLIVQDVPSDGNRWPELGGRNWSTSDGVFAATEGSVGSLRYLCWGCTLNPGQELTGGLWIDEVAFSTRPIGPP